jgi:hypothetical protein
VVVIGESRQRQFFNVKQKYFILAVARPLTLLRSPPARRRPEDLLAAIAEHANIHWLRRISLTRNSRQYQYASSAEDGPMQASREGIWWLPTAQTRDYLLVTNKSARAAQSVLSLYDAAGSSWSEPIRLPAYGTLRLSVRDLLQQSSMKGTFGGIKIDSAQDGGAIDSVHILYDEAAGFSAIMKMFSSSSVPLEHRDYDRSGIWKTRAPMLALSSPDPALALPSGTVLEPALLLRNTVKHPERVTLAFHWRNGGQQGRYLLPARVLAGFATERIDVKALQDSGAIPKDAHWAQVTLTTNGLPDEVMAVAASYDSTLRYGAQTPFSDTLADHMEGGQWQADATHTSIIAAGNGSQQPVTAGLTLLYDHGQHTYQLEHVIDADDQVFIDIGELIRDQVPDKNGNILPAIVASGAYSLKVISSPLHVALYEGKVITDKTYGHATYGCMICCGYGHGVFISDPTSAFPGGSSSVGVSGNDFCAGTPTATDGYYQTWSSTNTGVFTMSQSLLRGVSIGTAGMRAHDTSLPDGTGQAATHHAGGVSSCPVLADTASGTGNVYAVAINSADITTDAISVTLSGPQATGQLTLKLTGSSIQQTVFQGNASTGTSTYSFNLPSVPAAEYTAVTANWAPSGITTTNSYAYHIRVLGSTTLTQYNTPAENTCTGGLQANTVFNNQCVITNAQLISGFIFRVTNPAGGTGSGNSNNFGSVYQEAYCSGRSSTSLRSFQTIKGTLGPLSGTSVAACPTGPDYVAGARIYIVGGGVKTVTDRCPACCGSAPHFDNYSTSPQCSGVGSLPSAVTVRIY